MPATRPPSDDLLSRAAELRAGGATWESVAAKLHRAADTVRRWPGLYPDRWQALLRAAERRLVSEAGSESVLVLRQLLRSEDEKVRRDAARFLIDLGVELARLDHKSADPPTPSPQLTSDAARLAAFLEAHSDDELAHLAAELRDAPVPERGGDPPEVGGCPD